MEWLVDRLLFRELWNLEVEKRGSSFDPEAKYRNIGAE
jgi:hypothetical protein